ncbi:hypothetical protein V1264_011593 [Littorina saxatilis]|uniref:G-protein coupled receptors family 1 profile domain-containing protein n=1 Tax=Littorina saxatilis TaxID=31220 RepID=A0AAN9GL41_9CAEN
MFSSIACSETFSPAIPFFTCKHHEQRIPFTLVCDHRDDCCDASDEDFCHFPACSRKTDITCGNEKQCIARHQRCDKVAHCVDKSDEDKCGNIIREGDISSNTLEPFAVVDFTGLGNFTVKSWNDTTCPETHFQCPPDGYCMPVYVRCNEVNDCPGKEDEIDCDHYTCPGFYRCRDSKICLHHDHLCDGVFHCPQRDDELLCNFTCPENCTCYGHAFICTAHFSADQYGELRYLSAPHTGMALSNVSSNRFLIHLELQFCGIFEIGKLDLPNLQYLDLSYNYLENITSTDLSQLHNLRVVSFAFNFLLITDSLFDGQETFSNLYDVNFAGAYFQEHGNPFSSNFPNLIKLNLSLTKHASSFRFPKELRKLDLRKCSKLTFTRDELEGFPKLEYLYTDNYELCCKTISLQKVDPENCHAPKDELSSCDALLSSEEYRVFLAVYAGMALFGNLGSFSYRVFFEKEAVKMGFDVFVAHLCVADFMMGVYLAIIGVADRAYYGNYLWEHTTWKQSVACKVAGFLSLLSSEVSAFLICLITLERYLVISFPHKNLRFSRWLAHVACFNMWIIGVLLAAVPLFPKFEHWKFYSQSGVCIPLPITRRDFPGKDYVFGIMIVFNFILFILIAIGQLLIYLAIRSKSVSAGRSSNKSKEMAVARRLLAVVMTNFLCWFPIGLLGILARCGVPIPGEVNVAMAIFVLPFNSALNPFLYTFSLLMERRRKAPRNQTARPSSLQSTQSQDTQMVLRSKTLDEDEAWKLFIQLVEDGVLSLDRVRDHVNDTGN